MTVKLSGTSPASLYSPETIGYNSFLFSGGEVQVRLPNISEYDSLLIESRYPDSKDIIEIVLLLDAINNFEGYEGSVTVFLPYLPYARQDRVCYNGESFSLKAFLSILSTRLSTRDKIVTWDVHSPISLQVAKSQGIRLINVTADLLIKKFPFSKLPKPGSIVLAPDKGALERAKAVANVLNIPAVISATKYRNPDTGAIEGMVLDLPSDDAEYLKGKDVVMVDDICDGGRTFIELAKLLKGQYEVGKVTLYVTHGIFSKGFGVFYENEKLLIDTILTPNLHPSAKIPEPYLKGFTAPGGVPQVAPVVLTLSERS